MSPSEPPRGVAIESHIEIAAPPAAIWNLLGDVDGWGRWNPTYPEASGSIEVGDVLYLTIALPGMKPQKQTANVFVNVPDRRLEFGAAVFGGLLRATRYVKIEQSAPGTCLVSNGEVLGGLLGPLMARWVGARIREGLQKANEGLKQAAEARGRTESE